MKNIFNYIVVLSLLLMACDENPIMQSTLPVGFATDALKRYEVPAEPGTEFSIAFTVEEPFNCSVKSDQDWCKTEISWNNGIHIKLKIEDNLTSKNRTAKVTIASPKVKGDYIIEIEQLASVFGIENLDNNFEPEGEETMIYVSSDSRWTLEANEDWIEFDMTTGESTIASGPIEVRAIVKPNDSGIIRNAVITLRSASGKVLTNEVLQCEPWNTTVRIGDEDIQFDESKFDSNYPQMSEWKTAGRTGGIPSLSSQFDKTFEPGTPASDIIAYLSSSEVKYKSVNVYLKNGEYLFDTSVRLFSKATLIGESRDGVIIKLQNKGNISFYNGDGIGLRNMTIKGDYSTNEPDPTKMEETLVGMGLGSHMSLNLTGARNCFVDNVRIINSASHPIVIGNTSQRDGYHNTIRDVEIDGAYNKDGGYQGYFHIGGHHNLVTGCKVTHIRHISFQDPTSTYNVFYKNDVAQEVSFHNNDGGDNLVEHNKITIPETLGDSYCAIMGPWSVQHQVGGRNFIYRNKCLELNKNNNMPWSDNELYIGPWEVKPEDLYTNFRVTEGYSKPIGKTFYPIILK